jgi:MMP 1-O-methyltransferase
VKELDDVYHLPGMLTPAEVDCLFQLGQFDQRQGVIVEIGSWKGKSTVALARGSAKKIHEKIYAIDPHSILPEERYFEDTKSEFLANVARAGVKDRVIPMIMTSEEAAKGWHQPIRLLWIDGDHRYEPAKLDFTLWEPFLVEGGILALHDTIRKQGPKRVLWENVFRSSRFQEIVIVDNITAVRKVKRASLFARLPSHGFENTRLLLYARSTLRRERAGYLTPKLSDASCCVDARVRPGCRCSSSSSPPTSLDSESSAPWRDISFVHCPSVSTIRRPTPCASGWGEWKLQIDSCRGAGFVLAAHDVGEKILP